MEIRALVMTHAFRSHSCIVAAIEVGGSYFSSRRLWSSVYDKLFECTEHSANRNSSSVVPEVISRRFPAPCCTKLSLSTCWSENCAPVSANATDTRTQSNEHGLSIGNCDQSTLTPQEIPVRSASAFSEWQRGGDECYTVVPIPCGRLLLPRDTKVGLAVWQMSHFPRWVCWKIAQHLLYLFQ